MSYKVIRQPSGQFAIFSTYTDTIVVWDATAGEVEQWFVDLAVEDAKRRIGHVLEYVAAGNASAVYYQFAISWDEALEMDADHGGEVAQELRRERRNHVLAKREEQSTWQLENNLMPCGCSNELRRCAGHDG